jgi:predicted metalloprotease
MRWKGRTRSVNVEDRRGRRVPRAVGIGGLGGAGVLILIVLAMLLGVDPAPLLQGGLGAVDASLPYADAPGRGAPASDEGAEFVSVVLRDTEDVWHALFSAAGRRYEEPTLVLFSGATRSACGAASSATGPFYCPADRDVYIDLSFYDQLRRGFGAHGDFAQAYVIAHEVGHHVQTLLGTSQQVHAYRGRVSDAEYNGLSVRLELQADCFAGVWAHHAQRMKGILQQGDIEEALGAASAIGDDRIQRRTQGYVVPDAFTHGTSEQRVRWFRRGLESGSLGACDTFAQTTL